MKIKHILYQVKLKYKYKYTFMHINNSFNLLYLIIINNIYFILYKICTFYKKKYKKKVIIAAAEDKSWRVRLSLAKNFSEIANSYGKEITDNSLI